MDNNDDILKDCVEPGVFTPWEEVDIEIWSFTDMGIKVAVNDKYKGLVYKNEIFDDYEKGEKLTGFIKCVRDDGRIDISLQPFQGKHVRLTSQVIMQHLKYKGGKSNFNDKSSPEDIRDEFQVSKKVFKQAIGTLYKQGKIKITDDGIELVEPPEIS